MALQYDVTHSEGERVLRLDLEEGIMAVRCSSIGDNQTEMQITIGHSIIQDQ